MASHACTHAHTHARTSTSTHTDAHTRLLLTVTCHWGQSGAFWCCRSGSQRKQKEGTAKVDVQSVATLTWHVCRPASKWLSGKLQEDWRPVNSISKIPQHILLEYKRTKPLNHLTQNTMCVLVCVCAELFCFHCWFSIIDWSSFCIEQWQFKQMLILLNRSLKFAVVCV